MRGEGFTLVELLVVVAIMATLVAIMVPKFTGFNRLETLQNTAADLQTILRSAQNDATSGAVKCTPSTPAARWILEFTSSTSYQIGGECASSSLPLPTPIMSGNHLLPSDVEISNVRLGDCDIDPTENPEVSFDNISGETGFDRGSDTCPTVSRATQMVITLQSVSDSSKTVDVVVEKGGSIYVKSN